MGVLPCQREGCPNIMCDRLFMGRYLCNECFQELEEWKATWAAEGVKVSEVRGKLRSFLESPPGSFRQTADSADLQKEFDRLAEGGPCCG